MLLVTNIKEIQELCSVLCQRGFRQLITASHQSLLFSKGSNEGFYYNEVRLKQIKRKLIRDNT